MPGVDPTIICHKLSIRFEAKPIQQRPQKIYAEHLQALNDEVNQLFKANFIRKTLYPEYLDNSVLVKKKNGK